MVRVVQADCDELRRAGERNAHARLATHQRQLVGLELRKLGQALGRQLLGTDVGNDA